MIHLGVKKRKEDEVTIDVEILNFDKELNVDNTEIDTDPNNNFTRTTAGYYRSKTLDKDVYEIMLTAYMKYVTDEKLLECCHEYDTNVNECLNSIVARYAPKCKHYSKSIELRARIYVAACIYLVGHHCFMTKVHKEYGVKVTTSVSDSWLKKDIEKVKKYGLDHSLERKRKRKQRENFTLRQEVKNRQQDICKNFTYEACIGVHDTQLVRKVKEAPPNECKHCEYGCDTLPRHKTERSKHCYFFVNQKMKLNLPKLSII